MKKTRIIFMLLALIFVTSLTVFAAEKAVTVKIDAKMVEFDVQPTIHNGRTMVPLRKIFEALGATVEWDDATRTVTSTKDRTTIKVKIDSKTMTVNGKLVSIDVPAMIIGGRTLVPVRAISESFGCQVGWDGNSRMVSIINDKDNFTMIYAPGDRSKVVAKKDVDANLKVGWYRDAALKDNFSDEIIYNKLKSKADAIAVRTAFDAVVDNYKNYYLKFGSIMFDQAYCDKELKEYTILDSDRYFRYIVELVIDIDGEVDTYQVMLRLLPSMDGKYQVWSIDSFLNLPNLDKYRYPYTESHKKEVSWGARPDDFGAGILADRASAKVVSYKTIKNSIGSYVDEYVVISDVCIASDNDTIRETFKITVNGIGGLVEVDYSTVENKSECLALAGEKKVKIAGYVKKYTNSSDYYIDADTIQFVK